MLGIVSVNGARLNAGSVALSVARRWSEADQQVLFIDAGTAGPPLADRFGAAVQAEYSAQSRGLPSLISAHEPLNVKLVAEHGYNLDRVGTSRWALFGPSHPNGVRYAARWLGERFNELMEIDRERSIVVASSLEAGEEAQLRLMRAMPVLAIIAPASTREEAQALRSLCEECGLLGEASGSAPHHRLLVVEGESGELGDNELMGIAGLAVEGRLPAIDDDKLLRLQGNRKDRVFFREFDKLCESLLRLSKRGSWQAVQSASIPEASSSAKLLPVADPVHSGNGGEKTWRVS